MTPQEQIRLLIQAIDDDINYMETLPEEEAREVSRRRLQSIGVLDQEGNITDRYTGAFVRAS